MTALQDFCTRYGLTDGPSPRRTGTAGRGDLCELFAALGYTRGAEIGVWEGGFAEKLCRTVPGLYLTGIDPWSASEDYKGDRKNDQVRLDAAYEVAKAKLKSYPCTLLRMTSLEAARRFPDGSLDFIYVDANHKRPFIDQDLSAWTPKVRKGGAVSGHDYTNDPRKPWIEVQAAVDEFTRAQGIRPWFVLAADKSPSYLWIVA